MAIFKEEDITIFAKTNFRGEEKAFGIKADDRRRHIYVIGKTGMGKSVLLKNLVIQDIIKGKGVAFVDPHGDSAEEILSFVPKSRVNDVVYFNPSDLENPVAFNILEAVDEDHKHLIASGMMGVFKKIWPDVWSPRMEYILNNTILALLDYPGSTMLGINRMMSEQEFRNKVIEKVRDPIVRSFWLEEFGKWDQRFAREATAAIQNKVGQFISTPIVRHIIGQTKSTINMREIMDQGKVLIVNLSKGRIGEEAMALLGGMVVTRLYLAAMERVDMPEVERKDFYLYVDEFQNFATESFASILSEARKYRLNLVVAHQYIAQLTEEVRDAVFGNVGTLVSFRVGASDAEFLEKEFEPMVRMNDIINLPKYNIYLKLMIDGVSGSAFSAKSLPPFSLPPINYIGKVIKNSQERYGKPRKEVEEKISKWLEREFEPRDSRGARGPKGSFGGPVAGPKQDRRDYSSSRFESLDKKRKEIRQAPQPYSAGQAPQQFDVGQAQQPIGSMKKTPAILEDKTVLKEEADFQRPASKEPVSTSPRRRTQEIRKKYMSPSRIVGFFDDSTDTVEKEIKKEIEKASHEASRMALKFKTPPSSSGKAKEEAEETPMKKEEIKPSGTLEQKNNQEAHYKKTNWQDAVCDRCGKDTKVPFVPEEGRGIFCKACLREVRSQKAAMAKVAKKQQIETRKNPQRPERGKVSEEKKEKLREDLRELLEKLKREEGK